jgi:NADPH-dependent 2,4-dienoyl-CoA reductase/sulfur reductase-like enzyme
LREELATRPRVVVVGGGFIGAEVAASARSLGLDVDIVQSGASMARRGLAQGASRAIADLHRDHGVRVRVGCTVVKAHGREHVESVELSDGSEVPADLVVVGIGTVPATDWLISSGLPVNDGILCDEYLRVVGSENVWAVGDVARWHHVKMGREVRFEHWTAAREHAAAVAASLTGGRPTPVTPVPYVWSDQYDVHIQHVGESGGDVVERDTSSGRRVFEHRINGDLVGLTGFNAQRDVLQARMTIKKRWDGTTDNGPGASAR